MTTPHGPVAIVGIGCLFPNAPGLKEFWRLLRCGLDGISDVPATHWSADDYFDADPKSPDMTYCRRGGFLNTVAFDPGEFGIPPSTLEATDTSQLLGLLVAKAALRDAGYRVDDEGGRELDRDRVSVILGVTGTQELVIPLGARLGHPIWRKALQDAGVSEATADDVVRRIGDAYVGWQENSFPGLLGNVVAGRIANRLDLHGTNCVIDAACASSLAAIHLAVMELHSGRADVVVGGGVDALNDIFMHMCFSKTPALSPTGDARPFSKDGDGTVLGEGIGIVTLKRLEDAERDGDRIYCVIRGVGTSSDGRQNSIYAPHAAGQAVAIRRAYAAAGFDPQSVGLVEAHGTGTKVGDVVEFEALDQVFREAGGATQSCAIGSVKSQIGHTKAAAGVAGLIKATLALHHHVLPPTAKVAAPHPKLPLDGSPLYLNTQSRPWLARDAHPRRAGVSSFGFGGSNFHVLLEEYCGAGAAARRDEPAWDGSVEILAASGSTRDELMVKLDACLSRLSGDAPWPVLAVVARDSRRDFSVTASQRLAIVLERTSEQGAAPGSLGDPGVAAARRLIEEARELLARERSPAWNASQIFRGSGAPPGKLAFLFPGQGSQYVGMGRDLACVFSEMRSALAEADAAGPPQAVSNAVYPVPVFSEEARRSQSEALTRTDAAQPALGAVSAGMWRVLGRFGLTPDAVGGHSFGELVALLAAGRFDAATLHRLARTRGELMAAAGGDDGTMLAVEAPLEAISQLISEHGLDVVLANRNTPTQGVLSGPRESIRRAEDLCRQKGIRVKGLPVSAAFHSKAMVEAQISFARALRKTGLTPGHIPVYSNVTGREYPADEDATRDLLAQQLTRPVDFVGEVQNLYERGVRTFVEVGPRTVLTGLVRSTLQPRACHVIAMDSSPGHGPLSNGLRDLARVLAQAGALGHPLDLTRWETATTLRPPPKMTVPLVGANYRAPQQRRSDVTQRKTLSMGSSVNKRSPELVVRPETRQVVPAVEDHGSRRASAAESAPAQAGGSAASSGILLDALRVVQEGLRSMQVLQQQTAEAHQRFLEGQALAHRTFQSMMEGQQRLLERSLGILPPGTFAIPAPESPAAGSMAPPYSAPAPQVAPAAPVARAPQMDAPRPVSPAPRTPEESDPFPSEVRSERARAATKSRFVTEAPPRRTVEAEPVPPMRGPDEEGFSTTLLAVVSELTGYPVEMLQLDMDMEADLGIDSIKRVEILAAVQERVPESKAVNPEYMGSLRTLRQIVEYSLNTGAPASAPVAAGGLKKKAR